MAGGAAGSTGGGGGSRRATTPKGPTDLELEKGVNTGAAATTSTGFGLQGKFNAKDVSHYVNPEADARLNSILKKTGSPLRQGIIQQIDSMVVAPQMHPYACRFMFNPTTINVGYQASEEQYPVSVMSAAQLAGVALGPGTTNLSFSLLFDRTYEMAYAGSPDLKKLGVYRDIAALESVVGARYNFASAADQVIQPMQLVPCYFMFGGGGGVVGLTFIGAITQMQVSYATFSERMVPMRASVDITVQQTLGEDINRLKTFGGSVLTRQKSDDFARRGGTTAY